MEISCKDSHSLRHSAQCRGQKFTGARGSCLWLLLKIAMKRIRALGGEVGGFVWGSEEARPTVTCSYFGGKLWLIEIDDWDAWPMKAMRLNSRDTFPETDSPGLLLTCSGYMSIFKFGHSRRLAARTLKKLSDKMWQAGIVREHFSFKSFELVSK